ncbi:retrovirus-related pol polyprotein from transposon TNT 1-94 [Tanacetum coccineum]
MPVLSSTMTEGKIVSWNISEGDVLSKGQSVVVVESDKADIEVETFYDRIMAAIVVQADEAVNEERGGNDSWWQATTASSLEAEQDSGDIIKTQSKATPNEASSTGTSSGGGPRGNTHRSSEDSMKLMELMEICPKLQQRILDLETTKTTQANEIESLKKSVKKLKRRNKLRTQRLKRLYKVGSSRRVESLDKEDLGEEDASKQGRIANIDADAGVTLESTHFDVDTDMFGVHDLDGDEVIFDVVKNAEEKTKMVSVAEETVNVAATIVSTASTIPVSAATTVITDVEITLAQALAELKSAKLKDDKLGKSTTTISQKDKGKSIMVEEPTKMKKKDQISFDEQVAQRLQAQMQAELEEEEDRLARQREEEDNIALIEEWHNVQAMMDADYQMAQQLQTQEQEKLSIEEKSKLFVQLLEARKKHFTALRAQEKRNKPPTKAQKRNTMSTYLKNMAGYKQNQ